MKTLYVFINDHEQEYGKSNQSVPNDIKQVKQQLPGAVNKASRFICDFLKENDAKIKRTLERILFVLKQSYVTDDENRKALYAKKMKVALENYDELTREPLKSELNKEDFLKKSFLQYMLYAYIDSPEIPILL